MVYNVPTVPNWQRWAFFQKLAKRKESLKLVKRSALKSNYIVFEISEAQDTKAQRVFKISEAQRTKVQCVFEISQAQRTKAQRVSEISEMQRTKPQCVSEISEAQRNLRNVFFKSRFFLRPYTLFVLQTKLAPPSIIPTNSVPKL